MAKPEEVANNNVSNHEFHCLRLGVWTNISTVVLWVGAELFNTFFAALFIVFDHVVVLRHRHSVNDNRTRRTFSRLKGFLLFSGWFNDWDQFVVSFPSHHQLYSLTGQWMNVAVTHLVAVFSCLDTLMNGQRLPTRTSVIMNFIVWDALHGQVLQHKPYRKMFHCSKRSLQPHLSFSTSLLSSLTANPSMEQNINIIDNITR